MSYTSVKTKLSTCRLAKAAGLLDSIFRRERVAAQLGLAADVSAQAAPAILNLFDLSPAWDGQPALAYAAGSLRSALSVEGYPSGFIKPMRSLTEHRTT